MVNRFLDKIDPFCRLGFGKSRRLLGVDIGTTSIKVCLLKKTKEGRFALSGLACRSYDHDLLHDGSIIDRPFVAQELKDLLNDGSIRTRNAASALSSYSVITKRVTMPFLEKGALESAVKIEVENIIPFPLKDIYYSYDIMGADEEKERMMNLLIVAAKKEIVEGYIKTFELAGLNLCVLDVDIFAITNLIEQIYKPESHSILAADIGASVTNIAIVKGVNIEFTREILVGGKYSTSELAKPQRLGSGEAEGKKRKGNDDATVALYDFIANISSEINKTVNFYVATKPRETVGKIYLTGGSSLAPGLKKQIESDTGIGVEFLNPFLCLDDNGLIGTEADQEFLMPVALSLSTRRNESV
jgi:type IV pilus assembly protein PilM